MRALLLLTFLSRLDHAALALLRLLVGAFLVWGTLDNVTDPARMAEFVAFCAKHGIPFPEYAAPLSVTVQFGGGILIMLGLFSRWAGVALAANFLVAVFFVHLDQDFRAQFPALVLVAISVLLATAGAGRYALDTLIDGRR